MTTEATPRPVPIQAGSHDVMFAQVVAYTNMTVQSLVALIQEAGLASELLRHCAIRGAAAEIERICDE
ncbi:MAG: hypothetical protein BWY43_00742 [candidate division WS2 bacterium ADurb.Bin280]|uniref:Uncharacterized protein n=1 Tax=candidate division WS2 bacterium ADurb.Bin280 TaxID=1852829 RepID=A0A1V5SBM8_9BACT|nr:MAG: hypothetical protein BWY43_00742 [candidate division WS2 bacterium ADurb.Bin280]